MTSWQLTRVIAGTFVLLSLALGIPGSPFFLSQWWLAFTAFVGVNLLQSGITPMIVSGMGAMMTSGVRYEPNCATTSR